MNLHELLAYVDFATQRRTVKASGEWYANVASRNAVPRQSLIGRSADEFLTAEGPGEH
jgi:hypothetical protein